jgi:hypothetical protein
MQVRKHMCKTISFILLLAASSHAVAETGRAEAATIIDESIFVPETANAAQGTAKILGVTDLESRDALLEMLRRDDLALLGEGAEENAATPSSLAQHGVTMRQIAVGGGNAVIIHVAVNDPKDGMFRICRAHLTNLASPSGLGLFIRATKWCGERLGLP